MIRTVNNTVLFVVFCSCFLVRGSICVLLVFAIDHDSVPADVLGNESIRAGTSGDNREFDDFDHQLR